MNTRSHAIAARDAEIDASTQRAIAAREERDRPRPMTALESLAARLDVSPKALQNTLFNTVFKGCSEAEFIALVIVANTYNLNPLLREIYAFPKKGGGIQAIVGYDGWIRIANSHPQYDGFETVHIEDKDGNIRAAEGILYRKDRARPTKKLIYLKEFKRDTEPWNNSPSHMLDVRCFCQTVRLALGIPLGVEGIDDVEAGLTTARDGGVIAMPNRDSFGDNTAAAIIDQSSTESGVQIDQQDERQAVDSRGMTEVDEETARQLDAGTSYDTETGEIIDYDEQDEKPAWWSQVQWIRGGIPKCRNKQHIKEYDDEYIKIRVGLPDEVIEELDALIAAKRAELTKPRTADA